MTTSTNSKPEFGIARTAYAGKSHPYYLCDVTGRYRRACRCALKSHQNTVATLSQSFDTAEEMHAAADCMKR